MNDLRELVSFRHLFWDLFRRDLRVRYRGSVLGVAWTLVNPLILMGVYTLLFSVLMRVPGASDIKNFPLFVLSGLLVWVFFQASVQTSTAALVSNSSLVKQVRFPRQLLPLSVVASNLVAAGAMFLIIVPFAVWLLPETRGTFLMAVPLFLPVILLTCGLALMAASANALYRDVEHLITAILLPLFLLTPIFYSFSRIPTLQQHQRVVSILHYGNFLIPMVEIVRDPLFFGRMPTAGDVVYAVAVSVAVLALGVWVFTKAEDQLVVQL